MRKLCSRRLRITYFTSAVILCAFITISVTVSAGASEQIDRFADLATEAIKAGRYKDALKYLDSAMKVDSRNQRTHFLQCVCFQELKKYRSAIAACSDAIRIDPYNQNVSKIYSRRAMAYHDMGDLDRAIADYNRLIELDPFNWRALANRAGAWWEKGDLLIAEMDFETAIKINPDEPRLRTLLKEVRSGKVAKSGDQKTEKHAPVSVTQRKQARTVTGMREDSSNIANQPASDSSTGGTGKKQYRPDKLVSYKKTNEDSTSTSSESEWIELDDSKVADCRAHRDACLKKLPKLEDFLRVEMAKVSEYYIELHGKEYWEDDVKRRYWVKQDQCFTYDPYKYIDTLTGDVKRQSLASTFYLLPDFDYCDCMASGSKDCYAQACDIACKKKGYNEGITHRVDGYYKSWVKTWPGTNYDPNVDTLEPTHCGEFANKQRGDRLIIGGQPEADKCLCDPCNFSDAKAKSEETLFGFTFDDKPEEEFYDDLE